MSSPRSTKNTPITIKAIGYSLKGHEELIKNDNKSGHSAAHISIYTDNATGKEHLVTASGTTLEKLQAFKDQGELTISTSDKGFTWKAPYLKPTDEKVIEMAAKLGFNPK